MFNFLVEVQLLAKLNQAFVSRAKIKPYDGVNLLKTDGAQSVFCAPGTLFCVHDSIHSALVVNAVLEPEHMSNLVHGYIDAASQEEIISVSRVLTRIIPAE